MLRQRYQLIVNVLSNYVAIAIFGIVNFVIVGYVVRKLGSENFGLISLLLSLIIITDILGKGISQALIKHASGAISNSDNLEVNQLANACLVWLFTCGLIGCVILTSIGFYIDRLFEIPPDLVRTARLGMILIAFLRVLLCFPLDVYTGLLCAHQRYDLVNIVRSVAIVFRMLAIILYFEFVSPSIIAMIIISVASALFERLLYITFALRVHKGIRFGLSFLDRSHLYVLISFGGMMLVIHIANLIGYESLKWIIGFELNLVDVGGYTLIAALVMFAGMLVRTISEVLAPVASRYDALKRPDKNKELSFVSTKYTMIIASGLCIMPVFLLNPFLRLWAGDGYSSEYLDHLAINCAVLMLGQWFISAAVCILQMLTGLGKIRFPAVVTLLWAIGGVAAVWAYLHWVNNTLFAVVVGITIARVIGSLAHLIYGIYVLGLSPINFIAKSIFKPALVGLAMCLLSSFFALYINLNKVENFVLAGAILASGYALATWAFVLGAEERSGIIERIRVRIYG
ncbi:MAG: hypothetical protein A2173_11980 [Planctomycetes bacterium RBG_13_44_8b]|nr:MAG: hypothetical protein A2173_11980 [Planctomycetes bacterium RBG_13_44_8b]